LLLVGIKMIVSIHFQIIYLCCLQQKLFTTLKKLTVISILKLKDHLSVSPWYFFVYNNYQICMGNTNNRLLRMYYSDSNLTKVGHYNSWS